MKFNINFYLETVPETITEIDSETIFEYDNETDTEFIPETLHETFAEPVKIILKLDDYFSLKSNSYPAPYPVGNWEWNIMSGKDDFGIEVIIKTLDLNGENGDYVLLQPGSYYYSFSLNNFQLDHCQS